ncbi:hypothetical protein [Selenomonas ruminantium]|uniref:Uncharacterized protein n=1 Tax=Selenomonas ruminantium TaxID=971 RepID=A0A1H0NP31_SELRU|nr:hypothetical protein [Selenomonas ruminantium]SDO94522.1 hypothetical protein SAMN05216366_103150 [Selenomonas ruminantium]
MDKVGIKTTLREGLTEQTGKAMAEAEDLLEELFGQYNVPEKKQEKVVAALRAYVDGVHADGYGVGLSAGAELGDIRGYKKAMEEAEDAAAEMIVTAIMKK